MKRPEISFENDPETKLQKGILQYYKCAKILLDESNPECVQKCIRSIINNQTNDGKTPLHLAATDWPESIIKSLLKFGADLSIPDARDNIPLKMIPESTILDVLNKHSIKSKSKARDIRLQASPSEGSQMDGTSINNDKDFQELQAENEPRFLTNIVKSPVIIDYQLLAPKRNSANPNIQENKFCQSPWKSKNDPEMNVLSTISQSKDHQNILKHPVIKSFVWLKWYRAVTYYHSELRTNVLMTSLLIWYIYSNFGGIETNSRCALDAMDGTVRTPTFDKPEWNDASFCQYYQKYEDNLQFMTKNNPDKKYGALEARSPMARLKHHFNKLTVKMNETAKAPNEKGSCQYMKLTYLFFFIIAMITLFMMANDIKSLYFTSNPFRRQFVKTNRKCLAKFRPLLGYIRDLFIIIMVLIFSEKMVWISILILFLWKAGKHVLHFLVRMVVGYRVMPVNRIKILELTLLILVFVVMYIPNEYIYDPLYFSQSEQNNLLCPDNNKPATTTPSPFQPNTTVNTNPPKTDDSTSQPNITVEHHLQIKRALAAFIIVLSMSNVMFEIGKHPGKMTEKFNKYVQMYQKVFESFARLICVYILFLFAFGLGFYVMFHNDIGTDKLEVDFNISPYRFFETPGEALAKTFAMFVGEVDFNNMPIGISYQRRDGNVSVALRYIFFILFIFMMVMVLMNLLNGLAITDITKIVDEAEARHQTSMIKILKELEDRARSNQVIIEIISRVVPCLYPFIKTWGFLEELKIIHPSNSGLNNAGNEQGSKGLTFIQLPPENYETEDGFDCGSILREARQILLDSSQEKRNRDDQ